MAVKFSAWCVVALLLAGTVLLPAYAEVRPTAQKVLSAPALGAWGSVSSSDSTSSHSHPIPPSLLLILLASSFLLALYGPFRGSTRGMFFTVMSLLIIGLFLLVLAPQQSTSGADLEIVKAKILSLNRYVTDLESNYIPEVLRVSGYRSFQSMLTYMNDTNGYLNFTHDFQESVLNGTLEDGAVPLPYMVNATIPYWLDLIAKNAKDTFGVNTTFLIGGVRAFQDQELCDSLQGSEAVRCPFKVRLELDVAMNVTSDLVNWTKNKTIISIMDINGLDDPFYFVNTAGAYTNKISNRMDGSFVDERLPFTDISDLALFISEDAYKYEDRAPSFVMRFVGDYGPSACCGIESIVRQGVNAPPSPLLNRSTVDYLYWGGRTFSCDQLWTIGDPDPVFDDIQLDFHHIISLNVSKADAVPVGCP